MHSASLVPVSFQPFVEFLLCSMSFPRIVLCSAFQVNTQSDSLHVFAEADALSQEAMRETLQGMSKDAITSAEMNTVESDTVVDKQRRLEELQRQKQLIEKERREKAEDTVLASVRVYLDRSAASYLLNYQGDEEMLMKKAKEIMSKRLAAAAEKAGMEKDTNAYAHTRARTYTQCVYSVHCVCFYF